MPCEHVTHAARSLLTRERSTVWSQELAGFATDRTKYGKLLSTVYEGTKKQGGGGTMQIRRRSTSRLASKGGKPAASVKSATAFDSGSSDTSNQMVQRFKWFLGMPNTYYDREA